MQTFFSPEFFSNNRKRLLGALDTKAPVIITGNGQMQRGADEPSKFYQDSNFWYLTGLNGPDLTLVLYRGREYLIVPGRSFEREAFDGAHDGAAYAARSGVPEIVDAKTGWGRIKAALQAEKAAAVLFSPPSYAKRHGLYTLPYRRNLITKLRRLQPGLKLQDGRLALVTLRCIKQPAELQAIQRAVDITVQTLQEITAPNGLLYTTAAEAELEGALTYGFRRRGAEGHGFDPIVGAGRHTTTLHHIENNGPVAAGDLVVLDVGAAAERYGADITRTVSAKPITGRAAEIYHAVEAVQDYALSLIKPGVQPIDYEKAVEARMGEQLLKLGVIREATRENIRHYFPHGTSHFLGLDIHDVGDYRAPWQPNMVITCEPGIYIPEEGIGVRIEDDILITASGYKSLSAACPRRLTPVQ